VAVDQLAALPDAGLWIGLGDLLSRERDAPGAIRAYHMALRPQQAGAPPVPAVVLTRVRGDLGRAYAREGHYSRAEWLLRQCVYAEGHQSDGGVRERQGLLDRLNLAHLGRRPADASEFAHVISRRVEQLRLAGHYREAFETLREPRYLLEALLGLSAVPGQPVIDIFGDGVAAPERDHENRRRGRRPAHPRAWALSFLGKCYRLGCVLRLDLAGGSVGHYLARAGRWLSEASLIDPLLPYPYAHRLHLQREGRINWSARRRILAEVRRDLAVLPARYGSDGERVVAALRERFAELDEVSPGRGR
jgi:hypothetical protein